MIITSIFSYIFNYICSSVLGQLDQLIRLKSFIMLEQRGSTTTTSQAAERFSSVSMEKRSNNMKTVDGETEIELLQQQETGGGWLRGWIKWCPTSMSLLAAAERRILAYVKTPFLSRYVNVGPVVGSEDCKIWTISMNEKSEKTPLVLLHGLGSGVALWCLNFDSLAKYRPVYAFDFLGFGRSSRPKFNSDALEAEREMVASIEEWRKEMKLNQVILLGHSFGGFLATSYAIRYPERVSHLILADPWGFPEKPADSNQRYPIPLWVKAIAYVLQPLNPLWGIRVAGPMGPKLIEKVRPDLISKFSSLTESEDVKIAEYIFHCNAQNPTGEAAFHSMMSSYGWAKFPMSKRVPELDKGIGLTMIYGSRSWIDHSPGNLIKQMRTGSYVNVEIIQGAGHHVYADKKDMFNEIIQKACSVADFNSAEKAGGDDLIAPENSEAPVNNDAPAAPAASDSNSDIVVELNSSTSSPSAALTAAAAAAVNLSIKDPTKEPSTLRD